MFSGEQVRFKFGRLQAEATQRPSGARTFGELEEVTVTGLRASRLADREDLADYHLYRLPWPTDLNARQTKQAVFLDKRAVKVERFYRHFLDASDYYPDEEEPVVAPTTHPRLRKPEIRGSR